MRKLKRNALSQRDSFLASMLAHKETIRVTKPFIKTDAWRHKPGWSQNDNLSHCASCDSGMQRRRVYPEPAISQHCHHQSALMLRFHLVLNPRLCTVQI